MPPEPHAACPIANFADLLRPVGQDSFLAEYWEQRPLHIARGDDTYYQRLLTKDSIDTLIATGGLRFPAIQLAKGGGFYPPEAFTRSIRAGGDSFTGVPDLNRIRVEYEAGATISLPGLQRACGPLGALTNAIETLFSHSVHANGYIAPGDAPGFLPHYDTHEVFALQIAGSKHWRVEPPAQVLPHRSQPFVPADYRPGQSCLEVELAAGDLLYLPRGFVHSTHTSDHFSIHVTIGITPYIWADVIGEAVVAPGAPPFLRQALPPGFARDPALALQVATRLVETWPAWPGSVDLLSAVERFCVQVRSSHSPGSTTFDCDVRVIGSGTVLETPAPSRYAIVEENGQVVLTFAQRRYRFADESWPLFKVMCGLGRFSVSALPPDIDENAALTLARVLAGTGFLRRTDQAE